MPSMWRRLRRKASDIDVIVEKQIKWPWRRCRQVINCIKSYTNIFRKIFHDNYENTISHQILLFQPTSDLSQRWTWTLQQWRKVQMQTWNITSKEFCLLQRFISLWRLQKSVSTVNHFHHTFSHHSHSQILCVQKSMKHNLLNSQRWLYNSEYKT